MSRSRSFSSVIDETEDSGRLLENFTFDDIEEIESGNLNLSHDTSNSLSNSSLLSSHLDSHHSDCLNINKKAFEKCPHCGQVPKESEEINDTDTATKCTCTGAFLKRLNNPLTNTLDTPSLTDLNNPNSMYSSVSSSSSNSNYSLFNGFTNNIYDDFDSLKNDEKLEGFFSSSENICCFYSENTACNCQLSTKENHEYFITEEEKMEYQLNKTTYLTQRLNLRKLLKQRFQDLKLNSSFKLQPRNLS